eukprot:1450806-Rhodomonas_salina.1
MGCSGLALVIITHLATSGMAIDASALAQTPGNGERLYDGLYTITDSPMPRKARKQPYVPALVPSLPSPVKRSNQQIARAKLTPQQRAVADVNNALEAVRHTSQKKVSGLGALDQFRSSRDNTMGALAGPSGTDKENDLGALFSLTNRLQRKQEELDRGAASSPKLTDAESKNALGVLFSVHPRAHVNGHYSSDALTWVMAPPKTMHFPHPDASTFTTLGHHKAKAAFHPRRPQQQARQPSPSVQEEEERRLEEAQAEIARMRRELDEARQQRGRGMGRAEEDARLRTGSLSLRHILKGFPGLQHAFITVCLLHLLLAGQALACVRVFVLDIVWVCFAEVGSDCC